MKHKLHHMWIIGLTGGIGMGKSTVAELLRAEGYPVHDADQAVHKLMRKGGKAVKLIATSFPGSLRRGAVDRTILGHMVFGKPTLLKKLEKILHPLVRDEENEFLAKAGKRKAVAAILDIPLLFETGGQKRCDYVLCVTAPLKVQTARVMQRPGMTPAKLKAILARQMPDAKKRKRADFVIDTGGTRAATEKQLRRALTEMLKSEHA